MQALESLKRFTENNYNEEAFETITKEKITNIPLINSINNKVRAKVFQLLINLNTVNLLKWYVETFKLTLNELNFILDYPFIFMWEALTAQEAIRIWGYCTQVFTIPRTDQTLFLNGLCSIMHFNDTELLYKYMESFENVKLVKSCDKLLSFMLNCNLSFMNKVANLVDFQIKPDTLTPTSFYNFLKITQNFKNMMNSHKIISRECMLMKHIDALRDVIIRIEETPECSKAIIKEYKSRYSTVKRATNKQMIYMQLSTVMPEGVSYILSEVLNKDSVILAYFKAALLTQATGEAFIILITCMPTRQKVIELIEGLKLPMNLIPPFLLLWMVLIYDLKGQFSERFYVEAVKFFLNDPINNFYHTGLLLTNKIPSIEYTYVSKLATLYTILEDELQVFANLRIEASKNIEIKSVYYPTVLTPKYVTNEFDYLLESRYIRPAINANICVVSKGQFASAKSRDKISTWCKLAGYMSGGETCTRFFISMVEKYHLFDWLLAESPKLFMPEFALVLANMGNVAMFDFCLSNGYLDIAFVRSNLFSIANSFSCLVLPILGNGNSQFYSNTYTPEIASNIVNRVTHLLRQFDDLYSRTMICLGMMNAAVYTNNLHILNELANNSLFTEIISWFKEQINQYFVIEGVNAPERQDYKSVQELEQATQRFMREKTFNTAYQARPIILANTLIQSIVLSGLYGFMDADCYKTLVEMFGITINIPRNDLAKIVIKRVLMSNARWLLNEFDNKVDFKYEDIVDESRCIDSRLFNRFTVNSEKINYILDGVNENMDYQLAEGCLTFMSFMFEKFPMTTSMFNSDYNWLCKCIYKMVCLCFEAQSIDCGFTIVRNARAKNLNYNWIKIDLLDVIMAANSYVKTREYFIDLHYTSNHLFNQYSYDRIISVISELPTVDVEILLNDYMPSRELLEANNYKLLLQLGALVNNAQILFNLFDTAGLPVPTQMNDERFEFNYAIIMSAVAENALEILLLSMNYSTGMMLMSINLFNIFVKIALSEQCVQYVIKKNAFALYICFLSSCGIHLLDTVSIYIFYYTVLDNMDSDDIQQENELISSISTLCKSHMTSGIICQYCRMHTRRFTKKIKSLSLYNSKQRLLTYYAPNNKNSPVFHSYGPFVAGGTYKLYMIGIITAIQEMKSKSRPKHSYALEFNQVYMGKEEFVTCYLGGQIAVGDLVLGCCKCVKFVRFSDLIVKPDRNMKKCCPFCDVFDNIFIFQRSSKHIASKLTISQEISEKVTVYYPEIMLD